MKYKAIELQSGDWAVGVGNKKHFANSVGTKEFATEQALLHSMGWYQEQLDKAWRLLEKEAASTGRGEEYSNGVQLLDNDGTHPTGHNSLSTKGDCLC